MHFLQLKLKEALYVSLEALLRGGRDVTWPAIRKLLHDETETVVSNYLLHCLVLKWVTNPMKI